MTKLFCNSLPHSNSNQCFNVRDRPISTNKKTAAKFCVHQTAGGTFPCLVTPLSFSLNYNSYFDCSRCSSSYRSVVDPQTIHGNVHQVDHVPNGPTNSAATTTMFPLRLCGGKLLVAVTRERRYGPSRLRQDVLPDGDGCSVIILCCVIFNYSSFYL